MTTHPTTDNHNLARIEEGTHEDAWGPIINQDLVDPIEQRLPLVNRSPGNETAHNGALLIETDGSVHTGDGTNWNKRGELVDPANFAAAGHDHDSAYAAAGHNHDSDYAAASHGNEAHSSTFATETWVSNNYNNYSFSESHNDLNNVGASDHHAKYTDSEARLAVAGDGVEREIYVSSDGTIPSGADNNDIVFTPSN